MTKLSSEQIEAYRSAVTRGDVMVDREHLAALLDAYEATRPRPASQKPPTDIKVLVQVDHDKIEDVTAPLLVTGWYNGTAWAVVGIGMLPDDDILAWLPLPEWG